MNKTSPHVHGYLDYVTVVVFLLAPTLIGLTGFPAQLAYALAGIHLVMTLVTDFPLGAVKLIPFTIHGWIERAVGPLLVLVSLIPGFATDTAAQVFYLVIGVVIILVGLLTDYHGTR
ncbi:MAG: hypothetical protein ACREX9_08520 [Gammaproteobacteria bacterium]